MDTIIPLLEDTQNASIAIKMLSDLDRKAILLKLSEVILNNQATIMQENEKDLVRMEDGNPKKDRLLLNEKRIQDLAESLHNIAELQDPTNHVLSNKSLDNGLHIEKISVPLGVVGIIYESRPNVTIDVAALCLRSGNACVLRGGSDAIYSNTCLVQLIHEVLSEFNIPTACVLLLPADRKFVKEMLEAERYVDIIIPRGSQQLIDFVRENSRIPTIETGAGVCHTYVQGSANLEKGRDIVVNAKVSRPSVCNALDTVLVDKSVAREFIPMLVPGLKQYGVEIFADALSYELLAEANYPLLQRAEESDYGREFLDFKCSIKVVENIDAALIHIRKYSSRHSEAIIAEDEKMCNRFLSEVDAAAVYANASTRFTDGGVFGLGAEIGISTQKLHARGPFALEKLTTEKWIVKGDGQIRV
jgi:glutamate-5-semialdehyde dehydrogenase